jgi:hypothetical protein
MRRFARLLLAGTVATVLLAACQSPPPVAETKPKRKSFEDANAWQPSSAPAPAAVSSSGNANVDAQARQVQQSWEQARQATSDAERQRAAGEALKQTRAMAEQPSGQSGSGNQ